MTPRTSTSGTRTWPPRQPRDAIIAHALGLPTELEFAGVLPWQGIAEVTEELRLPQDGLLLDIACGRGGYGIEVALRAGTRLVGVDFSSVALEQATSLSARRLPAGRSKFQVGTLVATGLPTGVADGLMCVDAVQFAEPPLAALLEFRRLLTSGGRLALTCWEAVDPSDERVPSRIDEVDLRRDLPEAGFVDVEVHERPEWLLAERAVWEAAVAAVDSDAAVRSLQAEGRRSLDTFDSLRRVFATATGALSEGGAGPGVRIWGTHNATPSSAANRAVTPKARPESGTVHFPQTARPPVIG